MSNFFRPVLPCVITSKFPDRSAFAEEFRDANGFGWGVNKHPQHDLKSLIKKKVGSHSSGMLSVSIFLAQAFLLTSQYTAYHMLRLIASDSVPGCLSLHHLDMQSAEVERLNGVYNKLLKTAGVELIGMSSVLQALHFTCLHL